MLEVGYIGSEYVSNYIKARAEDAHKGSCGRVLVVAGSHGMAGAAVMSAKAALKSGAGLVTVAVPEELFNILQISVPESMCVNRDEIFDIEEGEYLKKFDAIAIGPGIGVNSDNMKLITRILNETNCPVIIDADAINTICRYDKGFQIINNYRDDERIVLTPHPGEANRMLECAGKGTVNSLGRDVAVRELADFAGAVVLLKGHRTLVTQPDDGISCNMTGNPGMATGGSGDVLTGVISGLAAGGVRPCIAARSGAYLHGLAGDLAADEMGQYGMTAMDIINNIPQAFKILIGI